MTLTVAGDVDGGLCAMLLAETDERLMMYAEVGLDVLRAWARGEISPSSDVTLLDAWIACIEGGDESADEAVAIVGFKLLGPGWRKANGGEAGVSASGCVGVDFCPEDGGFPIHCPANELEVDESPTRGIRFMSEDAEDDAKTRSWWDAI